MRRLYAAHARSTCISWPPPLSDLREMRWSSEAHARSTCAVGGGPGGGGRVRGAARAAARGAPPAPAAAPGARAAAGQARGRRPGRCRAAGVPRRHGAAVASFTPLQTSAGQRRTSGGACGLARAQRATWGCDRSAEALAAGPDIGRRLVHVWCRRHGAAVASPVLGAVQGVVEAAQAVEAAIDADALAAWLGRKTPEEGPGAAKAKVRLVQGPCR